MSAALASLAPADNCFDCRVYRAIELGPIGDPDDLKLPFHGDYTFGINNLGEVVWFGFVELESPCSGWAIRAYVRLPVPNYGLPAGTYQLTIPSGTSACIPVTAACDINDAGYIAGSVGGTLEYDPQTEQRAVLWRLDQATSGSPATIPPAIIAPSELALDEEDFEVGC